MNREGTTLVIVDMQPDLPAAQCEWLLSAVYQEIMNARGEDWGIVMLEHMHSSPPRFLGETPQWLVTAAAGNNPRFAMKAKARYDGSDRIEEATTAGDLPTARFRVCGVNFHGCIQATVNGLAERYPDSIIELVGHACNDANGINWDKFQLAPNVRVI